MSESKGGRKLVYRFLDLSYIDRMNIARELGLLRVEDENVEDMEVYKRVFRRASEAKLLEELRSKVEQLTERKNAVTNPLECEPGEATGVCPYCSSERIRYVHSYDPDCYGDPDYYECRDCSRTFQDPAAAPSDTKKGERKLVAAIIGVGIHDGLKSLCDSVESAKVWDSIFALTEDEWNTVCNATAGLVLAALPGNDGALTLSKEAFKELCKEASYEGPMTPEALECYDEETFLVELLGGFNRWIASHSAALPRNDGAPIAVERIRSLVCRLHKSSEGVVVDADAYSEDLGIHPSVVEKWEQELVEIAAVLLAAPTGNEGGLLDEALKLCDEFEDFSLSVIQYGVFKRLRSLIERARTPEEPDRRGNE